MISEGTIDIKRSPRARAIKYQVDKNGCFNCTSHKRDLKGYPVLSDQYRPIHISRYIYQKIKRIDLSEKQVIRHKCDNRNCININHLTHGSPKQNSQDMVDRGRSTYGERNPMAYRTEEDIRQIRKSPLSSYELSRKMGIPASSIRAIRNRSRWKHVK